MANARNFPDKAGYSKPALWDTNHMGASGGIKMGRKSRAKIENEFYKEQYFRYLKMLGDPEYKILWEKLSKVHEKLRINPDNVRLWDKKESIEKKLRNEYQLAIPVIPHSLWASLTEEDRECLELPIDPLKPLTEEEYENFPDPIFLDMDIVKAIPFEEPKLIQTDEPPTIKGEKQEPSSEKRIWGRIDYTGFLKDGRYLTVEIDTQNTIERIVAALKDKLEFLQDLGIIKFKSKHREMTVDVEKVLKMRIQGMSTLKIMQNYYQTKELPTYSPDAERYYKRIKRALQKAQKKK